jgi:cyclic pyranopterin phosphate synthase
VVLADSFQRRFHYLRLSLLPVCNFRCVYCLPHGNPLESFHKKHLTGEEIRRLVAAMADLGVSKVRLTGGEPTIRKDIHEVARVVSEVPGISQIALTTNGYRLSEIAQGLLASGVQTLNVSVDSLDRGRFHEITDQDKLTKVLEGIGVAREAGFRSVKINMVVLRGLNDDEIPAFMDWARRDALEVRFIELMPTEDNREFFNDRHLDLEFLQRLLSETGWTPVPRSFDAGPAKLWASPSGKGQVGIIRPYSKDFCNGCNRLRVTSEGDLQLCLFGNGNVPLRRWLSSPAQKEELKSMIVSSLRMKKASHSLVNGDYGQTKNLAAMGG